MKVHETLFRTQSALPLAALRRIDEICALFEAAWAAGGKAPLEAFLAMGHAEIRTQLFGELLRAELELRDKQGVTLSVESLRDRFPQYAFIIGVVLEQRQQGHGASLGQLTGPHLVAKHPDDAEDDSPAAPTSDRQDPGPADRKALAGRIKGYQIIKELGRGGMGVVYLTRHVELQRLVALKVILAGEFAGLEQGSRFRREALAAARLKHPNIVQIHAYGKHGGRPYLALEYVEGPSLEARLLRRPHQPRSAARMLEMLARAVHAAHGKGIVHRDLKPANILLVEEDSMARPLESCTPKITDFGLARIMDEDEETCGKSRPNVVSGTPSYMSPEQGCAGQITPATDVYALGVILYEMLTGRVPFQGTSVLETLELVRKQEPVSPRQLQARCPRDLETICLKCLEKDPTRRYASADELADDCAAFLAHRPLKARPAGVLGKAQRWARRNPVVAGLLAVVVLLLVTGTAISSSFAVRAHHWAVAAESRAGEARQQRDRAEQLATAEAQARLSAEWLAYANQVCLAQREFERKMAPKASMILDMCRPDFRHWEHAYLKGIGAGSSRAINVHAGAVAVLAVHPNGRWAASAAQNEPIKLWDVETGQIATSFTGHKGAILAVAFSPAGDRLAAAAGDGTVLLWEVAGGHQVNAFRMSSGPIHCAVFSPDGSRVAVASRETGLTVWDTVEGRRVCSLGEHRQEGIRMAFSSDSQRLATSGDGAIVIWDLGTGQRPNSSVRTGGIVHDLVFSPDGSRLAVAAGKQFAIWDLGKNEPLFACGEHAAPVSCLVYSPDGKRLFTGSGDQTVKVWESTRGQCLLTLEGHAAPVSHLALSRDGRRLVSTGRAGLVHVWEASGQPFSGVR